MVGSPSEYQGYGERLDLTIIFKLLSPDKIKNALAWSGSAPATGVPVGDYCYAIVWRAEFDQLVVIVGEPVGLQYSGSGFGLGLGVASDVVIAMRRWGIR